MKNRRLSFLFVLSILLGCSSQTGEESLKIGFGKVDLTPTGIFEDPAQGGQKNFPEEKYRREEKFAISDRVEGRWRPGSA